MNNLVFEYRYLAQLIAECQLYGATGRLVCQKVGECCILYFQLGRIVHAENEVLVQNGPNALSDLLRWRDGQLHFEPGVPTPLEDLSVSQEQIFLKALVIFQKRGILESPVWIYPPPFDKDDQEGEGQAAEIEQVAATSSARELEAAPATEVVAEDVVSSLPEDTGEAELHAELPSVEVAPEGVSVEEAASGEIELAGEPENGQISLEQVIAPVETEVFFEFDASLSSAAPESAFEAEAKEAVPGEIYFEDVLPLEEPLSAGAAVEAAPSEVAVELEAEAASPEVTYEEELEALPEIPPAEEPAFDFTATGMTGELHFDFGAGHPATEVEPGEATAPSIPEALEFVEIAEEMLPATEVGDSDFETEEAEEFHFEPEKTIFVAQEVEASSPSEFVEVIAEADAAIGLEASEPVEEEVDVIAALADEEQPLKDFDFEAESAVDFGSQPDTSHAFSFDLGPAPADELEAAGQLSVEVKPESEVEMPLEAGDQFEFEAETSEGQALPFDEPFEQPFFSAAVSESRSEPPVADDTEMLGSSDMSDALNMAMEEINASMRAAFADASKPEPEPPAPASPLEELGEIVFEAHDEQSAKPDGELSYEVLDGFRRVSPTGATETIKGISASGQEISFDFEETIISEAFEAADFAFEPHIPQAMVAIIEVTYSPEADTMEDFGFYQNGATAFADRVVEESAESFILPEISLGESQIEPETDLALESSVAADVASVVRGVAQVQPDEIPVPLSMNAPEEHTNVFTPAPPPSDFEKIYETFPLLRPVSFHIQPPQDLLNPAQDEDEDIYGVVKWEFLPPPVDVKAVAPRVFTLAQTCLPPARLVWLHEDSKFEAHADNGNLDLNWLLNRVATIEVNGFLVLDRRNDATPYYARLFFLEGEIVVALFDDGNSLIEDKLALQRLLDARPPALSQIAFGRVDASLLSAYFGLDVPPPPRLKGLVCQKLNIRERLNWLAYNHFTGALRFYNSDREVFYLLHDGRELGCFEILDGFLVKTKYRLDYIVAEPNTYLDVQPARIKKPLSKPDMFLDSSLDESL
jgi:hypothetical protein